MAFSVKVGLGKDHSVFQAKVTANVVVCLGDVTLGYKNGIILIQVRLMWDYYSSWSLGY